MQRSLAQRLLSFRFPLAAGIHPVIILLFIHAILFDGGSNIAPPISLISADITRSTRITGLADLSH